jgi:hypothetical protein
MTDERQPRTWNPLPIAGGEPTMQEILLHVVEEYKRKGYPYADTLRALRVLPRIPKGENAVPKTAPMLADEEHCSRQLIYRAIAIGKDALNGGGDVPLYSGNDGYVFTFNPERMAESRYRFARGLNVRIRRYRNATILPWARSLTDPAEIALHKMQDRELERLAQDAGALLDLTRNGRH